jgi:hypothetical protein
MRNVLLECTGAQRGKEKNFKNKWINVNEDKAHNKISGCTVIIKLKNLGKFLHKTKFKWENHKEKIHKISIRKRKHFKYKYFILCHNKD